VYRCRLPIMFLLAILFWNGQLREEPMPKLFIGNIPHASSDTELQEWVESQGFQVESAQIIRDRSTGQSRGFGFVVLNEEWKLKDARSEERRVGKESRDRWWK